MESPRSLLLPLLAAAVAAGAALAAYKMIRIRHVELKIAELEAALEHSEQQRAAERTGRIRAQRNLRKSLGANDTGNSGDTAYPMTPIGIIRSCFSTRNGTPRQPLLVPLAKAHLVLNPGGVPQEALEGLALYSHCWVLYVFHENTDLPRLWSKPAHRDLRAKVRVPRLDGGKMGIFATRTPHRPCPIGLSVAKVEGVQGSTLILSGVDLVDGTPVLDLKPYLTYCDAVVDATTPTWVKAGGSDDILAIACVECTEKFKQELTSCWEFMGKQSLYSSSEEFQLLLQQVLSRDIRSLCQRQRPHTATLNYLENGASEVEDVLDKTCRNAAADSRIGHKGRLDSADDDEQCELASFTASDLDIGDKGDLGGQLGKKSTVLSPESSALSSTQVAASARSGPKPAEAGHRKASSGEPQVEEVMYYLILEGIRIAYTVNHGQVLVRGATVTPELERRVRR